MNDTDAPPAAPPPSPYPVFFNVDYPAEQSRWKAIFRILLVIPALLFWYFIFYVAILALVPMWIAILVRGRAPRWLFNFQVAANRFNARVQAYLSLLTDEYPAFDEPSAIHYNVVYPDRLSRWQVVIWKFFASIPQWIVVFVLQYAAFAIVAVGWICIVFTKKFPQGLHTFVVGTMRWRERVYAYTTSLTDEYPPYSLSADATATKGTAFGASAAVGVLGISAAVAGIVALIIFVPWGGEDKVVDVSYAQVVDGELPFGAAVLEVNQVEVELLSALDPADEGLSFYAPPPGSRLVLFSLLLTNHEGEDSETPWRFIGGSDFQLSDSIDDDQDPILAVIEGRAPPVRVNSGQTVTVDVVFNVPEGEQPLELSFDRDGGLLTDTGIFRFY
jgi:hypothetical protein